MGVANEHKLGWVWHMNTLKWVLLCKLSNLVEGYGEDLDMWLHSVVRGEHQSRTNQHLHHPTSQHLGDFIHHPLVHLKEVPLGEGGGHWEGRGRGEGGERVGRERGEGG